MLHAPPVGSFRKRLGNHAGEVLGEGDCFPTLRPAEMQGRASVAGAGTV